jgi:K+-sensing histidine kinase KdpD
LRRAIELATPEHAKITVLGIARIFGTSLGFPHPGLQPTALEWADQRKYAEDAAGLLRKQGFEVRVELSRARNAPKMIARWAKAKNFHAIVVSDPDKPKWRRMIEGDPQKEINRRCDVPVYAVPVPSPSHGGARAS